MGRTSDAKQRLESAIYDLMWCKSYGSLTIDTICEAAKVKKGSFYYFFKSKTELAISAMESTWEVNRLAYDDVFSASKPPLERLADHATFTYEKVSAIQKEHGRVLGCPYFNVACEVCGVEPELAEKVQDILSRYHRYFTTTVREAVAEKQIAETNPEEAARVLYYIYEGMLTQARIQNDPEILKDLGPAYERTLGVSFQAFAR